jgi:polyisoprenoid-binding protein YceI
MPGETAFLQDVPTPLAGEWQIDPAHSSVGFAVRHMMVARVRGRFARFQGELHIDPVPERSSATATIDAGSVDTGEPQRDAHLRSADFLDVANHPTIEFHSTALRAVGDDWRLDGELTIRGTTRPVRLHLEPLGVQQMAGSQVAGFTATTEIDRHDFGLTWNQALETGGVAVGRKVAIWLEVEARRTR